MTEFINLIEYWKAEHLKRQQGEDAALQKVKDLQEALAAEREDRVKSDAAKENFWQIELSTKLDEREVKLTKQHEAAVTQLKEQHAAEIAKLKESVLVPALRDMQSRQAADLAARHKAELDSLTK